MPATVYYEDTDFSGFVYHANYLKFFERAREHLIGINYLKALFQEGVHFVVAKANVEFLRPAQHGDSLMIRSECRFSRSPTLLFLQNAFRIQEDGTEMLLVRSEITAACLNQRNRPIRLPDSVIEYFSKRHFDKNA